MTINNFLQPIEILNPIYDKNNCGVPSCNLQMKIKCIKSNLYDFDESYFIILSNLCHEQHVEKMHILCILRTIFGTTDYGRPMKPFSFWDNRTWIWAAQIFFSDSLDVFLKIDCITQSLRQKQKKDLFLWLWVPICYSIAYVIFLQDFRLKL